MKKAAVVSARTFDGSRVEFVNEVIGSGAMKDVYFSPDKSYVVAFYRNMPDVNARERLENITGTYRERIFGQAGGEYWKKLFCWPTAMLEWEGKLGIVCPAYQPHFFFSEGMFKGKEKEGKWFASARLRNKFLTQQEKGTWLSHVHVCLHVARAVRRLHSAGLAHSDLSYKNVLVDPQCGNACVIDIDGLVVPGKYPPDVVGTPDFIAPEVMATRSLKADDPQKKLPSITTDRHALAVLIYMYLLYRHPLRGSKVNDLDPSRDEELSMGEKALFIEHPTDSSNRLKLDQLAPDELPQADTNKFPCSICGPYLTELFNRAFIDGLHNPAARPTAADWETALIKTTDLIQPCQNSACEARWFVFDNSRRPRCPFCGTEYHGILPILNFYHASQSGVFKSENYRLMVYNKQSLYSWHANRLIVPNEKTRDEDKKPVGDFHFLNGKWILINRLLPNMYDKDINKKIEIGEYVELTEGKKIHLSPEEGGRLAVVQMVKN